MHELKHIIESLLFVADEPLTVDKLRGIIETADGKQIREALQSLADEYEQRAGGFLLREIAGGWQMRSRPEYHEWIKRMLQPSPQRLSRAALETLALIAYKQPIIRADIEHVRGVDCGGVLRQLMERKLIRVLGRKEIAGRPLIYATTKLFLEIFDLKDLNDLPTPMEIAEFGAALRDGQSEDATRNPAQIALDDPNAPGVSTVPGQPCPEPVTVKDADDSHSDPTGPICGPHTPRPEGEAGPEEKNDAPTPKNT
jgi:segregation and condensation protein B